MSCKRGFCRQFGIGIRLFFTKQPSTTADHCQKDFKYASNLQKFSLLLLIRARFIKRRLGSLSVSSDNTSASKILATPHRDFRSGATTGDLRMPKLRTGCVGRPTGPNFRSLRQRKFARIRAYWPFKTSARYFMLVVSGELPLNEISASHDLTRTTTD